MEEYPWTSLPPTQSLKNLGTLILDSCWELETISVVGDLVNLEILICSNCDLIKELPVEIGRLNRLKLLDISWCFNLQSIGRGIISSLVGLEELKMRGSFKKWEAEDIKERKNAGLRELESLTNLTCLVIEIEDAALAAQNMRLSSNLKRFQIIIGDEYLVDRPGSNYMSLYWEEGTCLGHWVQMHLLKDTQSLSLSGDGVNNLELEKIPYNIFTNLSVINIVDCPHLHNLGQLSIAGNDCLPHLEFLTIKNCEVMEQVFLWNQEEEEENKNDHITKILFPKLERVVLESLPNLTTFCQGIEGVEFPRLESMYISECPKMTSMISSCCVNRIGSNENNSGGRSNEDHSSHLFCQQEKNIRCLSLRECETGTKLVHVTTMDALFPRLEVLRLVTLFKLQEIWDIDDGPIPSDSFKNLKELRLEFLPALNHLWKSSNISPSQVNVVSIFSQLSSIYIYGCHSLRNLFTLPVTTSGSCTLQLEKLVIESCDMMEQVLLWNEESESHNRIHIPNLKVLILDSLPRLTSFCKGTESVEFPPLDRMRISRCPRLETQFSTYGSSYDQDDVDNDSAHLFCKPHQEKMELKVQGIITWGNMIQECVEYMSLEGDGSRISDVEVAQSMRCLVFREFWMNMTTIATVFPLLEVMWLVDMADLNPCRH